MIQNYKKNIFLYNKNNELITYVDLEHTGKVIGYYNLIDRELTKFNVCTYKEKKRTYNDIKKAKIIFAEDCLLHHIFIDGESRVASIKSGSLNLESPKVASKIYSYNDESIEGYTLNPSTIQDWLKKL